MTDEAPPDPIALLFGGMAKLGPGADDHTVGVLRRLPTRRFRAIVDAGCGTGRQTLALARELEAPVHAVDTHQPFLDDLVRRAREAKLEHLVQVHCMDMKDIPRVFREVELLWSEGAAYNIGFSHALETWACAMIPGGFVVVSELSWLREPAPPDVAEFFHSGYPDMRSVPHNVTTAETLGYTVLATSTLPEHAWTRGYYDVLEPRARALVDHPDAAVREFAVDTVREIEIFERSAGSYGYVFYVLQRG